MNWKTSVEKQKPQDLWFEVDNCMIHAHRWMHSEECTVVFIHGSMSNNVWWQPIASSLSKGIVLSIDLSGHGLSAWDQEYSVKKHAQEVYELIQEFAKGDVYIVAHSYGGYVAGYVATMCPIKKVILVDSPLHFDERNLVIRTNTNVYSDAEIAIKRFKPLPPQPVKDRELLEWVARRSLREVEGGYTWQFDPKTLSRTFSEEMVHVIKEGLAKDAAWWYGEHSPFVSDRAREVANSLGLEIEMISEAYHAIMLDAPEVLSRKIKELIGE